MEIGGLIDINNLPEDIHYSSIPFDRLEEIFDECPKEDKTPYTILTGEGNSAIYYVSPDLVRYSGGHTEESVARILRLKEEKRQELLEKAEKGEEIELVLANEYAIPPQIVMPRLMAMTQPNRNERVIVEVRDALILQHPPWWRVRNGGDQDFYLRDDKPAGRNPVAGEWLPNDICCDKKYLFAGHPHKVFTQFSDKGIEFKTERIPSKLLEASSKI